MEPTKIDRRSITSAINGRKGGRPKEWQINPYKMIAVLKQGTTFNWQEDVAELQRKIDARRKTRLKKEVAKYHKRPDMALKQIQHQKELRTKKLAELRYLRMVVRRLMLQLEQIDAEDLDCARQTKPKI